MTICDSQSSFQPSLNYQSLMLARYVLILQWYSFIILYLPVFVLPFSPETRKKAGDTGTVLLTTFSNKSCQKNRPHVTLKITVPDRNTLTHHFPHFSHIHKLRAGDAAGAAALSFSAVRIVLRIRAAARTTAVAAASTGGGCEGNSFNDARIFQKLQLSAYISRRRVKFRR